MSAAATDVRPPSRRLARVTTPLWVLCLSAVVQLRSGWSPVLYVLGLVQPATFICVTLLARRSASDIEPSSVALGGGLVSLWGATIWSSGGILRNERWQGTLPGIVARPTSLATVLVGKSLGSTLQSASLIAVTIWIVSAAFGDPIAVERPLPFLAALGAVFVSASLLGFLLGCLFVLTRAGARISEALMYPIFILGGLIIPISLLPGWVRPLSWIVSLRWGGELLRAANAGAPQSVRAWLLLGATTLGYALLARVAFRFVLTRVRRDGTLDLY